MPDPKVIWKLKDPELDRKRKEQLESIEIFVPRPPGAPTRCPRCGTDANEYRNEHNGAELFRPDGNSFICVVCEWNL